MLHWEDHQAHRHYLMMLHWVDHQDHRHCLTMLHWEDHRAHRHCLKIFAGSLLGAGVLAGAADPLAVVPFASVDATSVFFDPHPTNVELNITPTRQARRNFMGKPHRRKEWKKQPDKKCHYL